MFKNEERNYSNLLKDKLSRPIFVDIVHSKKKKNHLLFQVHTLSHREEALSWFCRSKGCLDDCTKVVYMGRMCETETPKRGFFFFYLH